MTQNNPAQPKIAAIGFPQLHQKPSGVQSGRCLATCSLAHGERSFPNKSDYYCAVKEFNN
jgi:hypothetical protein